MYIDNKDTKKKIGCLEKMKDSLIDCNSVKKLLMLQDIFKLFSNICATFSQDKIFIKWNRRSFKNKYFLCGILE